MSEIRTVVFIAFDGFQLLDLAGPLEVFDAASQIVEYETGSPAYRSIVATLGGRPVRSSSGVEVSAEVDLADYVKAGRTGVQERRLPHTVVVIGGSGSRQAAKDDELLSLIRSLADGADRTASVCTGALVLAAAGLLDGHAATTHWIATDLLAENPAIDVQPDRIFVNDRDRWTSAGVTAGIDMALALVEVDHGVDVAHQAARHLVVFARRPGGQAQFSAQLRAQPARSAGIADVQRWLPDHLAEDLTVEVLADRAGMSTRSFARRFRAETGSTPAAHVEQLRVEAARRLLESTDLTVAAVAAQVGFRHAETFHRAFDRIIGTTPAGYRKHFARNPA
ncbi:MAG: GlxA family transcriptional regulator [Acidimicrobiales bacterium]|nr:GlxA family transcriptional regulator [Acidimicrobiales bacterium]